MSARRHFHRPELKLKIPIPFLAKTIVLGLPVVALVAAGWQLRPQTIVCQTDQGLSCDDNLLARLTPLKQERILNPAVLHQSAKNILVPDYELTQLQVVWPNTLNLTIVANELSYTLTDGDQTYGVTQTGQIVNRTATNLINIKGIPGKNQAGELEASWHQRNLTILKIWEENKIQVKQLQWSQNHDSSFWLATNQLVVFDEQNIELNMKRLAMVLSSQKLKDQISSFTKIDVRFKLPVLTK